MHRSIDDRDDRVPVGFDVGLQIEFGRAGRRFETGGVGRAQIIIIVGAQIRRGGKFSAGVVGGFGRIELQAIAAELVVAFDNFCAERFRQRIDVAIRSLGK